MVQAVFDDRVVLGVCEQSGQWGHPLPSGAAREVRPPRRGQGTGDSWLCACVGLDTCSAGSGALGTRCLPLCRSILLFPSSLCSLDLKVIRRQRAGSAQLGYRCPAIPQTADSATLTSGSKCLVSPSRSPLVSPTRARESFLKCLLLWAQLCAPTPIHMLIFEPPAP